MCLRHCYSFGDSCSSGDNGGSSCAVGDDCDFEVVLLQAHQGEMILNASAFMEMTLL